MTTPLLQGKAVIVTGSGQGLGRAYAIDAARAGAAVVINDVDAPAAASAVDEILAAGGRATAVVGSVADWGTAGDLVATCIREFGSIDGLVANAAIMYHRAPWEETEADLRRVAAVNILGVQFVGAHAMRAMVDAGTGGSIVNVISGARLGIRGMSAYGASKGAVAAMTANWAIDAAAHGIRVNAISPLGRTRMASADPREEAPEFPDPSTVAPLVTALLSGATSGITGRLVRSTGSLLAVHSDASLAHEETRDAWSGGEVAATLNSWLSAG